MSRFELIKLRVPIVQAPLAGGPSTPRLAAAVTEAGGLGFLAAGYKTPTRLAEDIDELRSLTDQPFGVNVFAPPAPPEDLKEIERYAQRLQHEAERYGAAVGEPRHDDDELEAKLKLLANSGISIVSFTFGCPREEIVHELHRAGSDVWVTVTNPEEAVQAVAAGADALILHGFEAGGHRGYFVDGATAQDIGLLALIRLIAARVQVPLVAAGGIVDGAGVAAVLCAGAAAAQLGTALMLTPEAGTAEVHRSALRGRESTALTRAFSGRQARGIVNRFMRDHDDAAPLGYPDVHYLTSPIRSAAREQGDPGAVNLWAGQAYFLLRELPAGELVKTIAAEAHAAVEGVTERLS